MKHIRDFFVAKGGVRIRAVCWVALAMIWAAAIGLLWTTLAAGAGSDRLPALLMAQRWLIAALLLLTAAGAAALLLLVIRPLGRYVRQIQLRETLPDRGAGELRVLAAAYNEMQEEFRQHSDSLQYEADHDALTGLLNRGAFDRLQVELQEEHTALLLVDVDKFKEVNDQYGHRAGDQVLRKVASLLSRSFRSSDYPCRVGGDEFAVIMTDMTPELRPVVESKLERVMQMERGARRNTDEAIPQVTLSIGVAFSDDRAPGEDLFKLADAALYRVKENGRNGYAFYGDEA